MDNNEVSSFRAGAVEQLRTHTRRLNNLHPAQNGGKPFVELYEKGYGKDAAGKRPKLHNLRFVQKALFVFASFPSLRYRPGGHQLCPQFAHRRRVGRHRGKDAGQRAAHEGPVQVDRGQRSGPRPVCR